MAIEFGTNDLTPATATQMRDFLNAYLGGPPGSGGTGPTDPAAVTALYFPTDPALAKFPSPEDSVQEIIGAEVHGRPYLIDATGRVHTLKLTQAGAAEYWAGGASQMYGWSDHADSPPSMLLVRQGQVFVRLASGAIQAQNASGFRNQPLPPAWTTPGGTGGGTTTPTPPAMPIRSAVAPGSSGRVLNAGTDTEFAAALAAAQPGDTIKLAPGTYTQPPKAITVPILLDLGGATLDMTGKTGGLAYGKGCLVPAADCIVQNGTITGTAMDQGSGQLTSAIRPDDGCGYLDLRGLVLHDNQCGVGHGGSPVVIDIRDCNISNNGLVGNAGANTHNLYVGEACVRLTLTNVVSDGCKDAHAIKYRGPELIVQGGTFAASNGSCFDIPNGSGVPFKITGATMRKAASDGDHHLMGYGEEYQTNGLAGGVISGGTIIAACPSPFIAGAGGTITATGVAISGNPVTGSGGVVLVGF